LRELQIIKRNDCHAVFSTNLKEIPWPFVTTKRTPEHLREYLRNQSPILDQIISIFVEIRESTNGGRFFIDHEGVYWKDLEKHTHRFIEWDSKEKLQYDLRSTQVSSYSEYINKKRGSQPCP
jgi:hypothetical protein